MPAAIRSPPEHLSILQLNVRGRLANDPSVLLESDQRGAAQVTARRGVRRSCSYAADGLGSVAGCRLRPSSCPCFHDAVGVGVVTY